MTRDDMFAVWAGLVSKHTFGGACNFQNAANELAELAAAAERDACAQVCEDEICTCCWDEQAGAVAEHIAAAIRARGNQ